MKYRNVLFVLLGLGVLTANLTGCSRAPASGQAQETASEKEAEAASSSELTIAEILATRCSHGLTIECEECRYEVGVVKVDAALIAPADATATGLVQTIRVTRQKATSAIRLTGELALNDNATARISPRIAGIIRSVRVDIGAQVKADDVLFTLDSTELDTTLADYERNRAMAALAEKTYQREKTLFEQKVASESDLIEAQMRLEEFRSATTAAAQKLQALGFSASERAASLSTNRMNGSGSLAVRAPISGSIIRKNVGLGELVDPGKEVMELADLHAVWAWGGLYERDLAVVLKNMHTGGVPVELTVSAFPDNTFTGRLDYISGVMDEATRTIKVRTVIDNTDLLLRPGMFCEIRLLLASDADVLAIPKAAVLSDEGVDFVFKHMQDNYYLRQNIKIGRTFEDAVEIVHGLEPGVTIVAKGAFLLKSDVLRSKMGAGCAD
ncbi:MAG: efflux RND transporter periplasmic adaptor subunit [bacterium]